MVKVTLVKTSDVTAFVHAFSKESKLNYNRGRLSPNILGRPEVISQKIWCSLVFQQDHVPERTSTSAKGMTKSG